MALQKYRHPHGKKPDVNLWLEGEALERVHGDVLAKYSPVFKMMLAEQPHKAHKHIDLSDYDKDSVRSVLNYMYYGQSSYNRRPHLLELLSLASFLQMRELHAHLVPQLDTEDFIDSDPTRTINIAFYRDCKVPADMKNLLVKKYIAALKHMPEEKKRQLAAPTVMSLVAFDMPIEEKTTIVNLALDWLRRRCNQQHTDAVIERIRFPVNRNDDLIECISKAVTEGGIARDMLRVIVNKKRQVVVVTEPSDAPEIDPESVALREADLESECPVGGQYTQSEIEEINNIDSRIFTHHKAGGRNYGLGPQVMPHAVRDLHTLDRGETIPDGVPLSPESANVKRDRLRNIHTPFYAPRVVSTVIPLAERPIEKKLPRSPEESKTAAMMRVANARHTPIAPNAGAAYNARKYASAGRQSETESESHYSESATSEPTTPPRYRKARSHNAGHTPIMHNVADENLPYSPEESERAREQRVDKAGTTPYNDDYVVPSPAYVAARKTQKRRDLESGPVPAFPTNFAYTAGFGTNSDYCMEKE